MRFVPLARLKSASCGKVSGALLGIALLGCQPMAHEPSDPSADDPHHDEGEQGDGQGGQGGASIAATRSAGSSAGAQGDRAASPDAGALPPEDQALLPARTSKPLPGSTASGKDDCVTWTGNLAGYQVLAFNELVNNPRANEADYAYLVSGKQAVELPGPSLLAQHDPVDAGAYQLKKLSARAIDPPTLYPDWSRDIHEVTLAGPDGLLRYVVHGDDLEGEVTLARVRLCRSAEGLSSQFVLAGAPDAGGVASNLTIHLLLDGTPLRSTAPVWIEVRPL